MKTRPFEEIWQDIKKLECKDVYTLCRPVNNHIEKVNEKEIIRYSDEGKGGFTSVKKSAFKRVWRRLLENGKCEVKDGWKIACACLALLPEVEYSLKPVTIWLSENKHEFGKLSERIR